MKTVLIRKYANGKLYVLRGNTEPAGYIDLQDLIDIIRKGKDVKVICKETGLDLTSITLRSCLGYVEVPVEDSLSIIRGKSVQS